jgi:hypothetical protein
MLFKIGRQDWCTKGQLLESRVLLESAAASCRKQIGLVVAVGIETRNPIMEVSQKKRRSATARIQMEFFGASGPIHIAYGVVSGDVAVAFTFT